MCNMLLNVLFLCLAYLAYYRFGMILRPKMIHTHTTLLVLTGVNPNLHEYLILFFWLSETQYKAFR
jgi:hypothetical protein